MINHWKLEIPDSKVALLDATCYEVYIGRRTARFPSDVKLLWESCKWIWDKQIPQICKDNKLKHPRSKFKDQNIKYLTYSKLRKKSHRKTRSRKNALLKLLEKGINTYQALINQTKAIDLTEKEAATFKTIKVVFQLQKHHFQNPKAKIPNRIVSLFKDYIRPIVRGKENKPVEFGIKTHKLQVGGISIIEHQSYEAFNECKRLKISALNKKISLGNVLIWQLMPFMQLMKIANLLLKKAYKQTFVEKEQAKTISQLNK